ncbi:MAG: M28 family peptidase [Promethearchaeota archaeon]
MKENKEYSDYMFNIIDTICKQFGPRYSCSQAEREANEWIKKELDTFCDETHLDPFETYPGLYPQGLIKVTGFFAGISFIFMPLLFPFPILSMIFVLLGLFVLYTELILMKEWIKFLFKKETSSNVFGIIKPLKEPKFRIIFEGHTDSAKEMNIASYNYKLRKFVSVLGIAYLVITIIFSLIKFISQLLLGNAIVIAKGSIFSWTMVDTYYFILFAITYPFFLLLLRGFLGKTIVLGANDNLSGSAVSLAIGKYLSENRPNNVEVWVCSQGSEEVGDKGARAFVQKYGKFLENAYSVVLECCGAAGAILIIHKDMHKAIYSEKINEKLEQAYQQLKKKYPDLLPLKKGRLRIGACDAGRYIEEGYEAAALFGREKDRNKAVNWHSVLDNPENIDKNVLNQFFHICLEFVRIIDKEFD